VDGDGALAAQAREKLDNLRAFSGSADEEITSGGARELVQQVLNRAVHRTRVDAVRQEDDLDLLNLVADVGAEIGRHDHRVGEAELSRDLRLTLPSCKSPE
jgi:hypothetical protein